MQTQAGQDKVVTVFGGSGFLGSRVVQSLLAAGYRVRLAARHPERSADLDSDRLQRVQADIRDEKSVAQAVRGAFAAVNAVSLYVEKGSATFEAVHINGAAALARSARDNRLEYLIHVSGLGVSEDSASKFVRARARGEQRVRAAFPQATIIRPSVMFACGEGFLAALEQVLASPVVPLFGRGDTRLQPAFVEDVATGVARILEHPDMRGQVLDLGGAKVYQYREALRAVARAQRRRRLLLPLPFAAWRPLVGMLSMLPEPPMTSDQLILMQNDNVTGRRARGFAELGISPRSLEDVLPACYGK